MLAWWEERPEDLAAYVESVANLADLVVAFDGAYPITPGATIASDPEQAAAIRDAATAAGLEAEVVVPDRLWKGQVEKRDAMLRLAASRADWLLGLDTDCRVICNRAAVRAELKTTDADSILHDFYTPAPDDPAEVVRLSPHPWHTGCAGRTIEHSLLMRALPAMRVEQVHWGYSGVKHGRRITLGRFSTDRYPAGVYRRLKAELRIDHLCFARDEARLERNRRYSARRDRFKMAHGFEP